MAAVDVATGRVAGVVEVIQAAEVAVVQTEQAVAAAVADHSTQTRRRASPNSIRGVEMAAL